MARRSKTYGTGRIFNTTYVDKQGKRKTSKRFSIAYCVDGIERREATGKTLYGEALAILKDRLAGILPNVPTPAAETFTFRKVEELIEADYKNNRRKGIRKLQTTRFPPLRDFLGDRDLSKLTRADLLAYRKHRLSQVIPEGKVNAGQKYSSATANRDLAVLCHGLQLAVEQEILVTYPKVKKLREAKARSGFFEYPDFLAVNAKVDPWWRDLFCVAYTTGWRVDSELCPMTWSQVDLVNKTLRLEPGTTKNGEGRVFKFTPTLEAAMKAQRALVRTLEKKHDKIIKYVFPRQRTLLPLTSAYKIFKAAAIDAGQPEALVHDFRRTAVRNLEWAGVDRATAKAMVGHKTDSVYERYSIVDKRRLDAGAAKLSEYEKQMQAEDKKSTG